ncbi:MAG TPA: hypothetical protein DCL44_04235 [Elusimicrobia bacterium]|nr:hypothetical protein [Elusimicrobiota bacterium]
MRKSAVFKYILVIVIALAGLVPVFDYFQSMDAAEVIRKLSSLRISLELYRLDKGRLPESFSEVTTNGNLEASPVLKLKRHFKSSAVKNVPSFTITDSGSWAYVNNSKSPYFGLVFIDCAHTDEKDRFWSEF